MAAMSTYHIRIAENIIYQKLGLRVCPNGIQYVDLSYTNCRKYYLPEAGLKSLSEWYTVYPATGIILDMGSASVNQRYIVTSSLIDRANVGAIVYNCPCANEHDEVTLKNKWLKSILLTRKLTTQGTVCYIFPYHNLLSVTHKHAHTHPPPPPPPTTPTPVSNVPCVYHLYSLQHRE